MVADFLAQKFPHSRRRGAADPWRIARMDQRPHETDEIEPALDALLEDPIARALMASDGVERRDIERLIARTRRTWFEDDAE